MFIADNGLSHNGNNTVAMEISDTLQSQKIIEHSMDVDGSNGIKNLLDSASSTTTDPASNDVMKKVQSTSNGVEQTIAIESIDNHQDDDLIRELEQFEGSKKDDDVTLPKSSTEENGSKLQDTSDLLKDLESDSPCPTEAEIEAVPIGGTVESMDVDQIKKTDDGQVDSTTTQSSNKRKCSLDSFVESVPKRANIDATTEKSNAPDVLNTDTQKSTSEIDSDTESKLLQENSDGEASMSDVVEAITSTSTVTTTSNDVKLVGETVASNEDVVVSSSGNVETVQSNAESTKNVPKAAVSKSDDTVNVTSKTSDVVSSNKLNNTTEVMEQDFNETIEADRINGKDTEVTSNNSPVKSQVELPALGKTSETVASSQAEPVDSSESKPSSKLAGNTESRIFFIRSTSLTIFPFLILQTPSPRPMLPQKNTTAYLVLSKKSKLHPNWKL